MKKQKLATRTNILWYKAIYFTDDKDSKLCEYKVDTFETSEKAVDFINTQPEKQKGFMVEKLQRDVYLITK